MNIKPIRNEADHEAALQRIEAIFGAEPGTDDGDELDILLVLVERFEELHYPIDAPDPIEFLEYLMELHGARQPDLARLLGSRSRASEILNRKRPLTLDQIRKICAAWQVPVEPLIREYELSA